MLFRTVSQLHLLATKVDDNVFIDATMSMGLRNTCKLFEEDFMKAFIVCCWDALFNAPQWCLSVYYPLGA